MTPANFTAGIGDDLAEGIVAAARTGLGDTLRSVVYFTPAAFDVLYVRQDLYGSEEAARAAKEGLVEAERVGFAEASVRRGTDRGASSIGPYEFTVRFHGDGFLARVIRGDAGVLVTTDEMEVEAFDDAATAIGALLADR